MFKARGEEVADPGRHYETIGIKDGVGSLNALLNNQWKRGWKLAFIHEQAGTTILIFERRE